MAADKRIDVSPTQREEVAVQKQIQYDEVKKSFLGLYQYASALDIILVMVCAVCAILAGACQPLPTVCASVCVLGVLCFWETSFSHGRIACI